MKTMKSLYVLLACMATVMLTACAPLPINIGPDVSTLSRGYNPPDLLPAKVGYYFPPESEQAVTTPSGNSHSVTYAPYKQLNAAFDKMLGNVFQSVTPLTHGTAEEVARKGVDYVIPLKITTDSTSHGSPYLPPTRFSVRLESDVHDAAGRPVVSLSVIGEGRSEPKEWKTIDNHGLAGQRASLDALARMQNALLNVPQFKSTANRTAAPANAASAAAPKDAAETLQKLNELYQQGLISKEELAKRRAKALESF